jgi:apolipoprotein N-acyltransferase
MGFIIALAGSGLAAWAQQRRQSVACLALAALLTLSGWALQSISWTEPSERAPLRVALVQANIDQADKWQPDNYWPTLNLYRELSAPLWQHNDLVIWPEAAIPALYRQAESFLLDMQQLAILGGSRLVLGIPTTESNGSRHKTFNSIMVLGESEATYHKQRLVPFGEYVPLEPLLRGLIDFFDLPMSAFSRGNSDQPPLRAGDITLSPSVCYEVVYGDLVASMPGDILLTVSNDAWFGDSIGPLQHMQMAQMRALENGRYLIRATGNGISAIVDERGQIIQRSEQFKRQVLAGEARIFQGRTPYSLTGSWPWVLLAAGMLAAMTWRSKASNRP